MALFGGVDLLIYATVDRFLDANMDASLLAKARARSSLVTQEVNQVDIDWRGLADQLNQGGSPDLVQVRNDQGHILGDSPGPELKPPSTKALVRWNLRLPDGRRYRALALRFVPHPDEDQLSEIGNKVAPPCMLIVATDRTALDETQGRLGLILAGATVIALLASSVLIFWGVSRGLESLNAFGSNVGRIEASSLNERFSTQGLPAEVLPIAEKFNDLLSRLEISFVRERRFSADVSHELRTPIAEIRSTSEVMLKQPSLSGEARAGFQDVLDAACQMEALVGALMEIVRGERGGTLETHQADLCTILKAAWQPHAAAAQEKNLHVGFDLPSDFSIKTDERLLRLVLHNLFSNAVEYTPCGGLIETSVRRDGLRFEISVQNSTQGVGWEDLSHFFERFWRKDKARSGSSHFGLGLSVTQLLCRRLGIHLTVSMVGKDAVKFWLTSRAAYVDDQSLPLAAERPFPAKETDS